MGAGGGDGGGGGWAQPSGPKTQVGGAAGLHDLRRRRLGGTGGSPSGRWRRDGLDGAGAGPSATVAGAPPSPQRSATDTPVQGTPLLGTSLHLCPHHAARQPGSIPGSLAQSIAIPPTTELLRAKFLPRRPRHPHSRGRWSGDSQAAATNVRTMGKSGRGDGRRGNSHHPLPVSTVPVHGPEPSYHSD